MQGDIFNRLANRDTFLYAARDNVRVAFIKRTIGTREEPLQLKSIDLTGEPVDKSFKSMLRRHSVLRPSYHASVDAAKNRIQENNLLVAHRGKYAVLTKSKSGKRVALHLVPAEEFLGPWMHRMRSETHAPSGKPYGRVFAADIKRLITLLFCPSPDASHSPRARTRR